MKLPIFKLCNKGIYVIMHRKRLISFVPVGVKWLFRKKALQHFSNFFAKYVWDRTTSLLYFIVFLLPVAMAIRMKERPWNSQSLNRGGENKRNCMPYQKLGQYWNWRNMNLYHQLQSNWLFHQTLFSFVKKIKKMFVI